MAAFLRTLIGTFRKDITIWQRDRPVLAVGLAAPLALLLIMTLFFGGGGQPDAAPLVLVVEGQGPLSHRLAATFASIRSQVSPWWRLLPSDPGLFAREEAPGMAVIPMDFDESLRLDFYLHNWNSDMDQNYRYRLAYTLKTFEEGFPANQGIRVARRETLPRDVKWTTYMAGGILAYAPMVAGILYGGVSAARESERGRARLFFASPASPWATALGKSTAAGVAALVAGLVAWAFVWLGGLRAAGPAYWLLAVMALEALVFAGAGVLVGSRVRRQQLLMLPTGLIAIPLWFLSGGIGPVQLFPETLAGVARWLPTTYAFDAINDLVLFGATPQLGLALGVLWMTAVVMLVLAGLVMRKPPPT